MASRLTRQMFRAIGGGLLTGDTAAEVEDYHLDSVIVADAPSEEAVTTYLMARLTSGDLPLKDVPQTLARYGLMEVPAFIEEMQRQGIVAVTRAPIEGYAKSFNAFMGELPCQAVVADAQSAIDDYALEFNAFAQAHAALIDALVTLTTPVALSLADFFCEQVDDLRGNLGSKAADAASEDTEAQEAALTAAAEWVETNVTGKAHAEIAATLWMNGLEEGSRLIRAELP